MRLQALNTGLEEALNDLKNKVPRDSLTASPSPVNDDETAIRACSSTADSEGLTSTATAGEDNSLDEALALAQGFTNVVNGKETSVLEMLETLTELMDQHDIRTSKPPQESSSSPPNKLSSLSSYSMSPVVKTSWHEVEVVQHDEDEPPPQPISSPH